MHSQLHGHGPIGHFSASTITTNKAFAEWNQVFDSAACVVTPIDRLCHRAEIVKIDGSSFRAKEAEDRTKRRRATGRTETTK